MTIKTPHIIGLVAVTAGLAVITMLVESDRGQTPAQPPSAQQVPEAQASAAKSPTPPKAPPAQPVKPKINKTRPEKTPQRTTTSRATTRTKPRASNRPAGRTVKWDAPIKWVEYEAGVATAQKANKPILLFVYADW